MCVLLHACCAPYVCQTDELIDEAILTMQDNADVEDKGDLCQYVGVLAERIDEFTTVLRQPHLIEAIIIDL